MVFSIVTDLVMNQRFCTCLSSFMSYCASRLAGVFEHVMTSLFCRWLMHLVHWRHIRHLRLPRRISKCLVTPGRRTSTTWACWSRTSMTCVRASPTALFTCRYLVLGWVEIHPYSPPPQLYIPSFYSSLPTNTPLHVGLPRLYRRCMRRPVWLDTRMTRPQV